MQKLRQSHHELVTDSSIEIQSLNEKISTLTARWSANSRIVIVSRNHLDSSDESVQFQQQLRALQVLNESKTARIRDLEEATETLQYDVDAFKARNRDLIAQVC